MFNKLYKIIKKIIFSFFILYGYNVLVPASAIIPINVITVFLVTILNFYSLFFLIAVKLLVY